MVAALLIGLTLGSYLAYKQAHYINIVYVMYRFRKRENFEDLYELCDSEFNFEMAKDYKNGPKSYHEFLQRHQKARPIAGELFLNLYKAITQMLVRNYIVVSLLGMIIFRNNFLAFISMIVFCQFAYQFYLYQYKDNKIDYITTLIHNFIINDSRVLSKAPVSISPTVEQ